MKVGDGDFWRLLIIKVIVEVVMVVVMGFLIGIISVQGVGGRNVKCFLVNGVFNVDSLYYLFQGY